MTTEQIYNEILELKKQKNALILAHYYQSDEIQKFADYVGDSLALSKIAENNNADILIFCGVHFMAETAKILSPNKKVLIPVMEAGCSMANMINEIDLKMYKQKNPDTIIIAYVNSTAKVKALADVCVTSSNALKIIEYYLQLGKKILYCPDQNLGKYAMKLMNANFDIWEGYCCIHNNLTKEKVIEMKEKYPEAQFIAHPECRLEVLELSSYVGSTKQLIDYVTKNNCKQFLVGTENGVIYEMKRINPDKEFIPISDNFICPDMKLATLEDVYNCLKNETNEIIVDSETIINAKKSLDNMLRLS